MTLAVATLAGAGLIVGFLALRMANNAVRSYMQAKLGSYFEYAAMLYWAALSLLALLVFLLFVIPFIVWLGLVAVIFIVGAIIVELA